MPKPIFFYGSKHPKYGVFSQFYPCKFKYNGEYYNCAEQFMMACKARLFRDKRALNKIMKETKPGLIKRLGRTVTGFKEDEWSKVRFSIVVRGNYLKFSQNPDLARILMETGNSLLAEASPRDRVWGIGCSAAVAERSSTQQQEKWGMNLLGKALMKVRNRLRK